MVIEHQTTSSTAGYSSTARLPRAQEAPMSEEVAWRTCSAAQPAVLIGEAGSINGGGGRGRVPPEALPWLGFDGTRSPSSAR